METVVFDGTFAGWRTVARRLLAEGREPVDVDWQTANPDQASLALGNSPGDFALVAPETSARVRVPREFMVTARLVSCHRDAGRWALLYRLLWRLGHGESHLLSVTVDPEVHALGQMAKAIRRDVHKMRAFVRFREVPTAEGPWYVAWFEPHHHIVELNAKFFVDRFASMRWSILTPDRCVHWDKKELAFSEGETRAAAPAEDAKEDLWRTYYSSIFNPARLKIAAMKSEMATYYWKNLPEAEIIADLVEEASARTAAMVATSEALRPAPEAFTLPPVPATQDLSLLRDAAASCRACPLWQKATCTVFGEGSSTARVMVVGEQPGDAEDRAGKPFVGPAGQMLQRALGEAGIVRNDLYVTNAVKHFKWTPAGNRRLHAKPSPREVAACRPWLLAEIQAVQPSRMICLGGSAASSVLGRTIKVNEERGQWLPSAIGLPVLVTYHPAAILRQPDRDRAAAEYELFVNDLRKSIERKR